MKIKHKRDFERTLQKLSVTNPDLVDVINKQIKIFGRKPSDTRLKNHALRRRMKGKWAFSITDDIRIVYKWHGKNTVRFLAIGKHPRVYSRKN